MNDLELKSLWAAYDQKLEQSLALNRALLSDVKKMKAASVVASLKPLKHFAILVGIPWVLFLNVLLVTFFSVGSPMFLISVGLVSLLTTLAIGFYIYDLVLIYQIDTSESVLDVQEKLAKLQTATLWSGRLMWVQMPLYSTFYLTQGMVAHAGTWFWVVQLGITSLLAVVGLWLFFNLKPENQSKRWFRLLMQGREWDAVRQAQDLLKQVQAYKASETTVA
ncbi:hypothetical protein SAMN05421823_104416 [Catalinimonas alkaloidigena]|uniref:Uncharacterized protein n=1 Tax=Catalinimonas alkaloidigena TaxID=1075417 RepID=A0A1G9HEY1_9BACT|nr:hypothetical protein [Catalinimonas alkaloidigena]SDL11550.1 hypothetical protein SAMN05421823_104416 [Catalinimonas alkaloidigena]